MASFGRGKSSADVEAEGGEIGKDGAHYKVRYWLCIFCIFWPARD